MAYLRCNKSENQLLLPRLLLRLPACPLLRLAAASTFLLLRLPLLQQLSLLRGCRLLLLLLVPLLPLPLRARPCLCAGLC